MHKIHIFGKNTHGQEALVGTNYVKRFQRKIDGNIQSFNAQNSKWYTDAGLEIAESELPEWVVKEVKDMRDEYRLMYRINVPGEEPDVVPQEEGFDNKAIFRALSKLDPSNDSHWTEDGKPDLQAVRQRMGSYVPRNILNAVAPNMVRPGKKG
jgi:hypothetical protein